MNEQKPRCSREANCESYKVLGCSGCGFQHFNLIESAGNPTIDFLKDEYFRLCSKQRKGIGGRVALDLAFKKLVLEEAIHFVEDFPDLTELKNLDDKLCIGGKQYHFRVKCDASFSFKDKHVFIEIKGYGDDTNSILSAITAAQLISCGTSFTSHKYYYLGCMSAVAKTGLSRQDFFEERRNKVTPYVIWAEDKGFIKFYGIRDMIQMLEDVRDYVLAPKER